MKAFFFVSMLIMLAACDKQSSDTKNQKAVVVNANSPLPGFDLAGSDEKAMALADSVMMAIGGRDSWDKLRYIEWSFFGARDLLWDKWSGNVKIEQPNSGMKYYVNVNTDSGVVYKHGEKITNPDSIEFYVQRGKSIWINDSYWVAMPFKLKDSGVTLTYVKEDTTQAGALSDVVELNFKEVGNTPNNKYQVYIDKSDNLIKQWNFYIDSTIPDDSASAIWPWDNYHEHNGVLLSYDRSDNKGPRNLKTYNAIHDSVFQELKHLIKKH